MDASDTVGSRAPLPQLKDLEHYNCNTIDYATVLNKSGRCFVEVFRRSNPSFARRAANDPSVTDAPERALEFERKFTEVLDSFAAGDNKYGPLNCYNLCDLRDKALRDLGFTDCFRSIKQVENQSALSLLPSVLAELDAITDPTSRWEQVLRGCFAGNIFDLGASVTTEMFEKGEMSFARAKEQLVSRPWLFDDVKKFIAHLVPEVKYSQALVFVDNSGADVCLGMIPFARELLRSGCRVALAANELPTINDVIYTELKELVEKIEDGVIKDALGCGMLTIISSGISTPVIDLSSVSKSFVESEQVAQADLVVLEGMGRAIETNLFAQFKVDSLKLGMVKHPEVAAHFSARMYDVVCKFDSPLST